ncbi:MAG: hypothetical protein ACQEVA_04165, partial [Myxococcota bacterium]
SLKSLEGLEAVERVDGNVQLGSFFDSDPLESLAALENVKSIGGNLEIEKLPKLDSLEGLHHLASVEGTVEISAVNIRDVDHLRSLETIGGGLRIYNMSRLRNLDGLANLSTVGGDLGLGTFGFNVENAALESIEGLSGLTEIDGSLTVGLNDKLDTLDGLDNIERIEGDVLIFANKRLQTLEALSQLYEIGGTLRIINSRRIEDMKGLERLGRIGGDLDLGNSSVRRLDGLSLLEEVGGSVALSGRTEDTSGLERLFEVGGSLWAKRVEDASGFSTLTRVGGDFEMNLAGSGSLGALASLEAVGGTLELRGFVDEDLSGLASLERPGGSMTLGQADDLQQLGGMDALTFLGGDLRLVDLPRLDDLDALADIDEIQGDLVFEKRIGTLVDCIQARLEARLDDTLRGEVVLSDIRPSLTVDSQAELETFGEFDCRRTSGTLAIQGDVDSLEPLSELRAAHSIHIERTEFVELDGLASVVSLEELVLDSNEKLESAALTSLRHIGTKVEVSNHAALRDLRLPALLSVRYIKITSNPRLETLELSKLRHAENMSLRGLESLTSLEGFDSLTSISRRLAISESPELRTLDGLQSLRSVGNGILLRLENLTSVDALGNLHRDVIVWGKMPEGDLPENLSEENQTRARDADKRRSRDRRRRMRQLR